MASRRAACSATFIVRATDFYQSIIRPTVGLLTGCGTRDLWSSSRLALCGEAHWRDPRTGLLDSPSGVRPTAYAATRSTECGREALARYTALPHNTTVVAACELT